jgi:hypothetical protein
MMNRQFVRDKHRGTDYICLNEHHRVKQLFIALNNIANA